MWVALLSCIAIAVAGDSKINVEILTPAGSLMPTMEKLVELPPAQLPGLLYPRESETREVKFLFGFDNITLGFQKNYIEILYLKFLNFFLGIFVKKFAVKYLLQFTILFFLQSGNKPYDFAIIQK